MTSVTAQGIDVLEDPSAVGDTLEMEETRCISRQAVDALGEAGIFKMRLPRKEGGLELPLAEVKERVAGLAEASGSISWVSAVYSIPGWMLGRFHPDAQREVFSTPDLRVCGTLSPSGQLVPAGEGFLLSGQWSFMTGALHAQWMQFIAIQMVEGQPLPCVGVVPMDEVQIIDDWDTTGMRATGSVSVAAKDVLIPGHRIVPIPALLEADPNHEVPIHRAPLLPVAAGTSVAVLIGIARAAQARWHEQISTRGITYTEYESQAHAPVTHVQAARAQMLVDEAEHHAESLCSRVDRKCADRSEWSIDERVRCRAELGRAAELAQEAVNLYAGSGGARSLYVQRSPLQRYLNDINAVRMHALIHSDTNSELYGRVLAGLDPNSQYV